MGTVLNRSQMSDILMEFEKMAYEANAAGQIFEFFKEHKIDYDQYDECPYDKRRARLLIAGASMIDKSNIIKLLKQNHIDPSRVDMILDYGELQTYKWQSLQYSDKYSDIIVGPMGHSAEGKGDYNSIIDRMEQEDGWPHVIRATASMSLKITKNSLLQALLQTDFYTKKLSSYN